MTAPNGSRRHLAGISEAGFTLLEAVMVIVIIAVAGAGIATMTRHLFDHEDNNDALQTGIKDLQHCAERLLAVHREDSNAGVFEQALRVTCTDINPDISLPAPETSCPAGITGLNCRQFTLTINSAVAPGPIRLLLVK